MRIYPVHAPFAAAAELQAVKDGRTTVLRRFDIDRTNPSPEVGFDPYAPVTIACEPTEADAFRLVVSGASANGGLAEVEFSALPLVERYSEKSLAKMHQTPLPYWDDYMWDRQPAGRDTTAAVAPGSVVDISDCLAGDRVRWEAPAGRWMILRTGMVPTGVMNGPALEDGAGLEVDKWSPAHLAKHYDAFVGELCRRIPAADRKSWKVIVADSYEKGGQNFGDDFIEAFEARYGYDARPYLPVFSGLTVGDRDRSDRFLWDLRRMMADRLSYDHIGALRELAHRDGFTTWLENYGHWGFPGEFLQYGGQSDEVAGEYWSEGELGDIENRAASSCGHIYGKRKISAESNTAAAAPFTRYPRMMKQRSDRFFAEGINNTLLHVYISQPDDREPGINAWFSNEFNRHNTWFSQMDVFTAYLKRVNFMLQQGLNVADAAYFIGEDAPKMTGVTDPALPAGYQFDYMNAEVIEKYMTVQDGKITLPHGTQYRILVLPQLETMRPELLAKIKQLIEQGDAYYCFCGPEELESMKRVVAGKEISIYDKRCLRLSKEEVQRRLDAGEPHVIRFNMPTEGTTTFHDVIYGDITVNNEEMEDLILIKSDGYPTYNFANVIDDHLMGITHVVRGNEYLSSAPKYNRIYEAFGWEIPVYVHCPLITNEEHQKLSKRSGHSSYEDLLDQGFVTEAIVNFVALLGWSPQDNREIFSLPELVEAFDYHHISKSPAVFDITKLRWMNGEYIKKMDPEVFYERALPYMKEVLKGDFNFKKIAGMVQTRIETFPDIPALIDFFQEVPEYDASMYCHKKMKTNEETSLTVLKEVLPLLEAQEDYTNDPLFASLSEFVKEKGYKNGYVMWPLRTAVSGKQMTPAGATEIMEIIGKDETIRRVKAAIEKLENL